jgi:hypothetical protein
MKYMIWDCDKQSFASKKRFGSLHVAEALCRYMNENLAEPLYAVVVEMEGVQICF